MSTWLQAHQTANFLAAQAHADLGVDPRRFPIDIYAAVAAAGIKLVWQPMPRAFGIYLNMPGCGPGALINNQVPAAVQRHTAGHELGHYLLGHGDQVDFDLDPFATNHRFWPEKEKAAEAFAVWFLMPRRAVRAAMIALGLTTLRRPEEVYQLSLLLGTSYQTTARHLPNIRLCTPAQSRAWMAVPPGRLKDRLDPGAVPASRAPDVHRVHHGLAGRRLTVRPGDRLVIDTHPTAGTFPTPSVEVTATPTRTETGTAADDEPATHQPHSSSWTPVRAVAARQRLRAPAEEAWPVAGPCVGVEITAAAGSAELHVRVGPTRDPDSWAFAAVVEPTHCGPYRDGHQPIPAGPSHTITLTATLTASEDELR